MLGVWLLLASTEVAFAGTEWTPEQCQADAICKAATAAFTDAKAAMTKLNAPTAADICKDILANNEPGKKISGDKLACINTYKRFFAKDTIDLRIAMGYLDFEGITEDRARRAAMVQHFKQKPCPANYFACEFVEGDKPGMLKREMTLPNGEKKTIVIRVQSSSDSPSDANNRVEPGKSRQLKATAAAKAFWEESLKNGDAVFYDGHSRNGGGPSFEPPMRIRDVQPGNYPCVDHVMSNGMVCAAVIKKVTELSNLEDPAKIKANAATLKVFKVVQSDCLKKIEVCEMMGDETAYGWYGTHRDAAQEMYKILKEASPKPQPKLLSMNSCLSTTHFKGGIAGNTGNNFALLSNNDLAEFDYMMTAPVKQINSLLGMKCEGDYMKAITDPTKTSWDDELKRNTRSDGYPSLTGFFKK